MIAGDVVRFAALASVPLAAVLGVLTLWQLYAAAFLHSLATVFFDVSYQSYLPSLVRREELVEGNAKLEGSHSVAQIGGPTLGGFLVQLFTAPFALLADAISFLVSAGCVLAIRTPEPRPERPGRRALPREIGEGLRFVLGHRVLRPLAVFGGTFNLFGSALDALIIVFLVRTVGISAGTIGVLFSVASIGGVAGVLLVSRLTRWIGSARTLVLAGGTGVLFGLLLPLTRDGVGLTFFVLGELVLSLGVTVGNVVSVSFRQRLCPPRLLGRANATMRFISWGTMPAGGLLGGALGTVLGLRGGLWVAVGGQCLAWLWLAASPLRRMRDIPTYEEGEAAAQESAAV